MIENIWILGRLGEHLNDHQRQVDGWVRYRGETLRYTWSSLVFMGRIVAADKSKASAT